MLSNRSLCWIRLGQGEQALADAKACRALRPDWPKAFYREGAALRLMEVASFFFCMQVVKWEWEVKHNYNKINLYNVQRFEEAATCFYEGVQLAPENVELATSFR